MSLIKTLMGRRQFLIASGVASTCALTCKKLANFETRSAMAAEAAATAAAKSAGNKCPNLLSPLKIRNRVLKNRIMHCVSPVYTLQGPENYPSDAWRNHYSNIAKNAAIITMEYTFGKYPKTYHSKEESFSYWSWEHISNNKWEDIPPVWNYIERAVEDIHSEGTLIVFGGDSGAVGEAIVAGDVGSESGSDGMGGRGVQGAATMSQSGVPSAGQGGGGQGGAPGGQGGAPSGGQGGAPGGGQGGGGGMPGMSQAAAKSVAEVVADAKEKEEEGFDIYQLESPTQEMAQAVRAATNMLIISSLSVGGMGGMSMSMGGSTSTSNKPSSSQIEQAVEAARKLEGVADILLMKGSGSAGASWESSKYEEGSSYYYAEAIKKAGIKIATCIGGGTHNPIKNDEYIAKGATDMVGMTRPLFADMDLVKKVAAGRADDVIPCLQCQNCHSESMSKGPHFARCTVNPKWATPVYKLKGIEAPLTQKKVAVIGGGPAGMKAALVAAERGHKVTLYEKDSALGGLQRYTDYSTWVWTYKNYKDYLINQIKKAGIQVKLNTEATRDMINKAAYDSVIVATGADIVESKMKATGTKVFNILEGYSKKDQLGQNVVMIGAGKFGTEAALSMALDGRKVTVLSATEDMIGTEDIGAHNVTAQTNLYKSNANFKYHLKTTVKGISNGKVTFTDKDGKENSVQADSVVIWAGLKARTDDAETFAGTAAEVIMAGQCSGGDDNRINRVTRSAFYAASRV